MFGILGRETRRPEIYGMRRNRVMGVGVGVDPNVKGESSGFCPSTYICRGGERRPGEVNMGAGMALLLTKRSCLRSQEIQKRSHLALNWHVLLPPSPILNPSLLPHTTGISPGERECLEIPASLFFDLSLGDSKRKPAIVSASDPSWGCVALPL